jgi:hypothetical protein
MGVCSDVLGMVSAYEASSARKKWQSHMKMYKRCTEDVLPMTNQSPMACRWHAVGMPLDSQQTAFLRGATSSLKLARNHVLIKRTSTTLNEGERRPDEG